MRKELGYFIPLTVDHSFRPAPKPSRVSDTAS